MVQLSKKKLEGEISQRINRLFFSLLSTIYSQVDFQNTIIGIMSHIELDILARRIAILLLLIKKVDRDHIHTVLKVSHATISKYAMILANNESVKKRFTSLAQLQNISLFIREIEHFILYPGRIGSDWSSVLKEKNRFHKEKRAGV